MTQSKLVKERIKKQKIGSLLCMVQVVMNIVPAGIALGTYGSKSTQVTLYGSATLTAAAGLLILGLVAFSNASARLCTQFAMLSVSGGSTIAGVFLGGISGVNELCSVNQIAYKNCNNYTNMFCAIDNSCTEEMLDQAEPSCMAPPSELCADVTPVGSLLMSIAVLCWIFNAVPAGLALEFARLVDRYEMLRVASTAVQPVSPQKKKDKAPHQLEEEEGKEVDSNGPMGLLERLAALEAIYSSQGSKLAKVEELFMLVMTERQKKKKKKEQKGKQSSPTSPGSPGVKAGIATTFEKFGQKFTLEARLGDESFGPTGGDEAMPQAAEQQQDTSANASANAVLQGEDKGKTKKKKKKSKKQKESQEQIVNASTNGLSKKAKGDIEARGKIDGQEEEAKEGEGRKRSDEEIISVDENDL